MSSPVVAAPVAVLVLAWDEASPTLRALVEATETDAQAADSIAVVVPVADTTPDAATQEEFLPLEDWPALAEAAPAPPAGLAAPLPTESLETEGPEEAPLPAPHLGSPLTFELPAGLSLPASELAIIEKEPAMVAEAVATATEEQPPAPAEAELLATLPSPVWSARQPLRLRSLSLPMLAERAQQVLPAAGWWETTAVPAAPYLGSTTPAARMGTTQQQQLEQLTSTPAATLPVPEAVGYAVRQVVSTEPLAELPATSTPPAPPAAPPLPGAAFAAVEPVFAAAIFSQPAADSVSSLTEQPILWPAAPTPTEGDLEQNDLPLPDETDDYRLPTEALLLADDAALDTSFAPAQAGWTEAQAALQQPATPEPAAPVAAAAASAPLATAGAAQYPAPNLNFQIIQYARFAVPVALADAPFDVIYAPAWPTWLAAQELRQRTGRALVLHVAALAAPDDEPLDLAPGWQAEIQRQALHRADLILTETTALAHRLRHELHRLPAAVRVVPAADAAAVAQALHSARPVARTQ